MTEIIGILNVTRDSFSDGGRWLDPRAAVEHAHRMVAEGAAIIDVGAESTHPDAEPVPAEEEIRRLAPVLRALCGVGVGVSVDTHKPAVMRFALEQGATIVNDVNGLRDPVSVEVLRGGTCRIILMHNRSVEARARPPEGAPGPDASCHSAPGAVVDEILAWFERRLDELERRGIARRRLILDPGMGLFLSKRPEASLVVLRELERLKRFELPICVSTSRKSFIGQVLADATGPRPVGDRGAGTLATEIWAALHGADYIRTHDVRALHDALRLIGAIQGPGALPAGSGPGKPDP